MSKKKKDVSAEETQITKTWSVYKFKNDFERTLLTQPKYTWFEAKTIGEGNCGVDAIAIALGFERSRETYKKLRKRLAKLILRQPNKDHREEEALAAVRNNAWLTDDQLVLLGLYFEVIPIIFDAKFDPLAQAAFEKLPESKQEERIARARKTKSLLPHQHMPFQGAEGFSEEINALRTKNGKATKYMILRHVAGCHWICLAHVREKDVKKMEGFMFEDELPLLLLDAFLAYIQQFEA